MRDKLEVAKKRAAAADEAGEGRLMTTEARLPTRQLIQPDVPKFDTSGLDADTREALAELLLTMADDEFVIGFWDSEWTGIAPMLEEDVAWSSIAQDEIGHARVWYEMLAQLTGDTADQPGLRTAAGRIPARQPGRPSAQRLGLFDRAPLDVRAAGRAPPRRAGSARRGSRWPRSWPRSVARSATT